MLYFRKERKAWYFRIWTAAGQLHRRGGATKKEAALTAQRFILENPGLIHQRKTDLYRFALEIFLPMLSSKKISQKSQLRIEGILNNHLLPAFDGPLREITESRIHQFIRRRLRQPNRSGRLLSSDTVIKEIKILKQILREARKRNHLWQDPFLLARLPRPNPPRERYLQPEDWKKIWKHLAEPYRLPCLFLVNTGCRRGELCNLKWSDLDLINGLAILEKTKTHKGRAVPLLPHLVEKLKALPRIEKDQVFWNLPNPNCLTDAFRRAARAAGIQNIRLHDLRHTFASWLRLTGNQLDVIQRLLGHADPRMTQRYAHITPELVEIAIRGLAGKFEEPEKEPD